MQHLRAACLVWQIMLTKTITSGRSLCLQLMAWSWPDSRVWLFELCLCTAAFFDQVLVSNSEDLYWAAHVTSRISWSFMNLYRTSYVRCGCGDVLLLDACQSHLGFVFQGRCCIFGCLEFLDLDQQTYTECSPFAIESLNWNIHQVLWWSEIITKDVPSYSFVHDQPGSSSGVRVPNLVMFCWS